MNTEKQPDSFDFLERRTTKPLPPPCPICLAQYSRCPITGDIVQIDHDLTRHGLIGGKSLADT